MHNRKTIWEEVTFWLHVRHLRISCCPVHAGQSPVIRQHASEGLFVVSSPLSHGLQTKPSEKPWCRQRRVTWLCRSLTLMLPRRYYEDVADLDISAIINHHARMEDIDVNALAAQIDAEQLNGMASPPSPTQQEDGSCQVWLVHGALLQLHEKLSGRSASNSCLFLPRPDTVRKQCSQGSDCVYEHTSMKDSRW